MPSSKPRRALAVLGSALVLALSLAAPAVADTLTEPRTQTDFNRRANDKAQAKAQVDCEARVETRLRLDTRVERLRTGNFASEAKAACSVGPEFGTQAAGLTRALTWQSNDAPTKDRAIYHCVRGDDIVGAAHIVDRNDATRFMCNYDKKTDWPYGVKVYQPANRRLVVKVGLTVVQDYDSRAEGRDVWVVMGNPIGWWRTIIT